ncbi:MAG: Tat pathway signal sequence [Eggerthellaceae bacterium]|nr:Tat pathway signal sequence [Eggerthellaceae bacterium]
MASGFDNLLDALKQSGMNVDNIGGSSEDDAAEASSSSEGASAGGSSSGSGRSSRSRGDMPFGGAGFPFTAFGGGRGNGGRGSGGGDEPPTVEFASQLGDRMASWSKRTIVVAIIVAIIIILAAYWWFHPPISINSVDTWMFVTIFILLPCFLFFRGRSRRYETGDSKLDPSPGKSKSFKVLSFVPVIILALGLIGWVASLDLFPGNAKKYAEVLQTDTMTFAEDIQEVNYSQIPVIDRDSAILLGNREMGTIPDYVSQFEIDTLYSQINYQGEPVRVSPLGYADLFKWFTNRGEGIPAYALVNMTTQDAEIVRLGEGNGMKYTASEPLARNIDRYIQLKYPFYIFDEKSFEIDEEGQPWWICPVRKYTIGLFGGETIDHVVLCNASTGECEELSLDEVPQWVDRVYPAELLIRQYNWSGRYQQGWFNSWLGQSGVVQTTPGSNGSLGYNYIAKDDDVWVYTGVTSATADNSIVGFVLVDQRTAESHYYAVAGATETSAMDSAEGQVQNLRYTSTFPLLINVSNQPTYFMALKDAAGLVKKFAMIDIQRYQNVAVGDTVLECQKNYETLLATNGTISTEDIGTSATFGEANGTIRTMAQAVIEGNSHFYVTLEGDDAIYDFVLPGAIQIVGYTIGDEIAFTFVENEPTNTVSEITSTTVKQKVEAAVEEETASSSASSAAASASSSVASASSASAASGDEVENTSSSAASTF